MYSNSGSYTGDDTANRAIAHGLGRIPSVVIIKQAGAWAALIVKGVANIGVFWTTPQNAQAVTSMDATNFYVGNAGSFPNSGNATATSYFWNAM